MSGGRWQVVFGAVLIQLSLGAIYAWSVFTPALRAAEWSRVETQVVFSVGPASFALVSAGINIASNSAMIAITTSNSISVNAFFFADFC